MSDEPLREEFRNRGPTHHYPATAGVVLGLGMPGMDGPATLREMRRRGIELPVLTMSGGPPLSEAEVGRIGASEHLLKPFTAGQLLAAVARIVGSVGGAVEQSADVSAEARMKHLPDQPSASGMFTITRY